MNLHSLTLDDFLPDFDDWRAWADTCKFRDEVNPADGVTYPLICRDVPSYGMQQRLTAIMGMPVRLNALFLRMSPAGIPVPHWAHHDGGMGRFSCMVYLNRPEDCQGGTALLSHVDGEIGTEAWKRDTNRPGKWTIRSVCDMRANRAFIFRADLWHAAMPIGGFGQTVQDARLVMTAFFE